MSNKAISFHVSELKDLLEELKENQQKYHH